METIHNTTQKSYVPIDTQLSKPFCCLGLGPVAKIEALLYVRGVPDNRDKNGPAAFYITKTSKNKCQAHEHHQESSIPVTHLRLLPPLTDAVTRKGKSFSNNSNLRIWDPFCWMI